MKQLPIATRVYVGGVIAAACAVLALRLPDTTFDQPWLFTSLLLVSLFTSGFKVALPLIGGDSSISATYAVDFLALLLLQPGQAILVAVAGAWSQCVFKMRPPNPLYRTIFSMASLVITLQIAILVYVWLGGIPGHPSATLAAFARPVVGATTTYFLLNTLLIATAVATSTKVGLRETWKRSFIWSAPGYFVGAGAAALIAWAMSTSGFWLVPLIIAPLYLTYRTYRVYLGRIADEQRHARQMSDLHLATIEALALAIDAKDRTAPNHLRRVQVYATRLAQSLDMSENDMQGVKTAALLHDIGKLAVPEYILAKPGPLSPEEFQKVRIHPQVGAEIIGAVPFPYPVAPLILSHHERWDGRGYPTGLKGEEIPLGARILCVIDYFDALISDRPYHKAMTVDAAAALLRQEAGKALDPHVVEAFIALLPELTTAAQKVELETPRLTLHGEGDGSGQLASPSSGNQPSVLEDIALAHREIYALYQIAQAMGTSLGVADTMALIASKLTNLVPFSACALFLYSEPNDTLECRFATGTDAELIRGLAIRSGHGMNGWVARNRRPLVNARPSADFDAAGVDEPTVLQSALVCPLVFGDRLIGTLAVYHADSSFYRDDHRRLLDRVCEQAAAVIHNSTVFERTQEDSLTDPLTGLPNTRFMFMHLTRELARAERLKSEVSLLVLDLDDFKEINDTHGHNIGDRALRQVATILRNGIRPYDICVRYAGDEFIVVLSGCDRHEAERKRLELQQTVDQTSIEVTSGTVVPLSVSVGAAVFPHDGASYEALLAKADSRMYEDKTIRKDLRRQPVPPLRLPETEAI
jgi:diguanylate cyclase (GGDEF)-like protein/putative nucleotidyltransferase with HDIG domain